MEAGKERVGGVGRQFSIPTVLAAALVLLILASPALAERWSFAAIGDNRSVYKSYRNVLEQIRTLSVNVKPRFPAVQFVLAAGDLDPVAKNDRIYREVFKGAGPVYVPVRGNHEKATDVDFIVRNLLPGLGPRLRLPTPTGVQYCLDWNNSRVIVLDQYRTRDKTLTNPDTLRWLETAITSASHADHVFIAFHEPVLPKPNQSDPFWDLLVKHRDKVRAVFVGHTHVYERREIGTKDAGIDIINVGNAGKSAHSDNMQTIVEVMVADRVVFYRAVRALDETREFRLTEEWERSAPPKTPAAE